jgi:hypothetical protein
MISERFTVFDDVNFEMWSSNRQISPTNLRQADHLVTSFVHMATRAQRQKGRGQAKTKIGREESERAAARVAANPDHKRVTKLLSELAIAKGLPATKPTFVAMARNLAAHRGEGLDRGAVRRKDEAICYICEHPEWTQYDLTAGIELNTILDLWTFSSGPEFGDLDCDLD